MHGSLSLFAATPPGLETVTEAKLVRLGAKGTKPVLGGVEFEGNLRTLYLSNLWLRSAQRVLVRIAGFFVVHLAKLRKKLDQIPFEHYLDGRVPIDVRATCRKSRVYHSKAAAERAALAVQARLGLDAPPTFGEGAPSKEGTGVTVVLRIDRDHCTVSLDSSGEHLHRRGYRAHHQHEAPLRENLAAAMLCEMGYDGTDHFWDPMCGSGTLPIEAALIASNTAPGLGRRFAMMHWPCFDGSLWDRLVADAKAARREPTMLIGGSDIDELSIAMSHRHAESAGVDKWVRFKVSPVSELRLCQTAGTMLVNPPYGRRIGEQKRLKEIYHELGTCIARHSDKWRLGILTTDSACVAATGLDMRPIGVRFPNGGLRVQLYTTLN